MPLFRFDKLVRDDIVASQQSSGATPHFRLLNTEEHIAALVDKIIEEAREILDASGDDIASEIADVQQALDDLSQKLELTKADIAAAQARKNTKAGAFKKGIFIETVEVPETYPWIDYWRENPGRYPEIK